jgi:hypothetical protein
MYQDTLVGESQVTGRVKVTVYDGPTARVLQADVLTQSVAGMDTSQEREQAVNLLAVDLERAVDVLRVRDQYELYRVRMDQVKAALAAIEHGDWEAGRAHLETAATQVAGEDKETQAHVWYNLGLARWFAPGENGLTQAAYEEAAQALRQAEQLESAPKHRNALAKLTQARDRFVLLEQQRAAMAHNFDLAQEVKTTGPAPQTPGAPGAPAEPAPPAPSTPAQMPAAPPPALQMDPSTPKDIDVAPNFLR